MPSVVVDTHAALWYLFDDPRLSPIAGAALDQATREGAPILLPSICLVETTYLVEKGRVKVAALERLISALDEDEPVFILAPLDRAVAAAVRQISRSVIPDLPDRVIAATALALGVPLVTRDAGIRAAWIQAIW